MSTSNTILAEIQRAAERLKMAPSTLCQRAVGNSKLPVRLAEGRTVTLETVEKIRAFVRDHEHAPVASTSPRPNATPSDPSAPLTAAAADGLLATEVAE